jgi:UDP-GlcNAc:undecaprenyl-phosphate GlcNAc-1-phosphate transferase
MINQIFRILFISTLFSFILGIPVARLAGRIKLIDIPGSASHKKHSRPTPLAGGAVILLTLLLAGWLIEVGSPGGIISFPSVKAVILPGLIIFLFGLLDDWRGLPPFWKLFGQTLGAAVMIAMGIKIQLFDKMPWLNIAINLLWVVGVTNAYNFIDSMDGLANGLASLAAAFFILVTIESNQPNLTLFSTLILGACLGSYYFTTVPARFFLGDSGAQLLGFVLAGLAIAYNPLGYQRAQSWFIPILLVGVPIFDLVLVVVSRMRRHSPIYRAGLDHTYHRLVSLGMEPTRAVLTLHFIALMLSCAAFISLSVSALLGNLVFVICLLTGFTFLIYLDHPKRWPRI